MNRAEDLGDLEDLSDLKPWQRRLVRETGSRQHRILLVYLCRNGATSRRDLEAACDVGSVTSRMSELAANARCAVQRWRVPFVTPAGRKTWTVVYEVSGPGVQLELFEAE